MQPVPEGYEPLDFVGFTDRGIWSSTETYIENDIVHKDNTAWRCLTDDTIGAVPSQESEHWEIFISATNDSSGITTTDTEGLVGPAGEKVSNQDLIDAIAEKVAKQLVTNISLTNILAGYITKEMMSSAQTDDPDKVPTSALAYAMQQSINSLNENMNNKQDASTAITTGNVAQQSVHYATTAGTANAATSAGTANTAGYATTAGAANAVAWGNVSGKPGTYPPSSHTHDDRYYTEAEVNNLLWNEFKVVEFFTDNVALAVGAHTKTIPISQNGYWAAAIIVADVMDATSGGSNCSQCSIYGFGLDTQSYAFIRVRCWQAAKVCFRVKILYWKDPR